MQFRYGVEERPPLGPLLLFGLQWLAIALPGIIILGRVVADLHFDDPHLQVVYLQKLSFMTAATLAAQIVWGHRLPLILGPAAVLLVGVAASPGADPAAIYTAVLAGGVLLALAGAAGLFSFLQRLFTRKVVATVLLLIAFTLAPTLLRLVTTPAPGAGPLPSLLFALALLTVFFTAQRRLGGLWKSTLIIWGMLLGTGGWFLLYPAAFASATFLKAPLAAGFFSAWTLSLSFEPGLAIAFFFCFLALAVNDLGSIQSMEPLLHPEGMPRRLNRGMAVTGLGNALAGLLGVVGPVNFSLSPGVIASTGCASRFALLPTAAILLLLSFSPAVVGLLGLIPPVVIGAVLIYILTAQIAAGLSLLSGSHFVFEDGLIVGLPVLLGTLIAFLPAEVTSSFPSILQPILGNGFVIGVVSVLLLEHLILRR